MQKNNKSTTKDREPWEKTKLLTKGISRNQISGLYLSEQMSVAEMQKLVTKETKELYPYDEVFGQYCNVNEYINCPVDAAYEYAANVYSLEEWTYTLRDLKYVGAGLYEGREHLVPNTSIFVRSEAYPDSRTVDYLCAWDQGEELWMRYYMRFVDALPTFKKPGTVLMWLNCQHPYYDRSLQAPPAIKQAQQRSDRPWVGDFWKYFYVGHCLEAKNFKRIMEHRFAKT